MPGYCYYDRAAFLARGLKLLPHTLSVSLFMAVPSGCPFGFPGFAFIGSLAILVQFDFRPMTLRRFHLTLSNYLLPMALGSSFLRQNL
jgi:hypothetical protein